ncbi:hypothetical protein ACSBR1_022102 [Camellia fascicularis]
MLSWEVGIIVGKKIRCPCLGFDGVILWPTDVPTTVAILLLKKTMTRLQQLHPEYCSWDWFLACAACNPCSRITFGARLFTKDANVSSTSSVLALRLLQLFTKSIPWPLFFYCVISFGASYFACSMVLVAIITILLLSILSPNHGFIGIEDALTIYTSLRAVSGFWRLAIPFAKKKKKGKSTTTRVQPLIPGPVKTCNGVGNFVQGQDSKW